VIDPPADPVSALVAPPHAANVIAANTSAPVLQVIRLSKFPFR
jgi:hypothetical protein